MNSLSWLLYAADALPSIAAFAAFAAVLIGIACTIFSFMLILCHEGDNPPKFYWGTWAAPFVLCALLSTLIPSQETIYLIAASEIGEQVVETPEAQETFDRLQRLVDQELDRLLDDVSIDEDNEEGIGDE